MDAETERISAILRQAAAVVEDLSRGRRDDAGWVEPIANDLRPAAFTVAAEMLANPITGMRAKAAAEVARGLDLPPAWTVDPWERQP